MPVLKIRTRDDGLTHKAIIAIIKLLIVFAILYDINFVSFGSITSGRIAISVVFIYVLFRKGIKFSQNDIKVTSAVSILLFLSLVQSLFSNDFIQFSRLFFLLTYGILAPLLVTRIYSSLKQFFIYLFISVLVQSIILIFSFITPSFKDFIGQIVVTGANYTIENIYRAFGLTSSSGASLSLIQSLGVITGLILLVQFSKSIFVKALIVVAIAICLTSTAITGRTGLLISVVSIIIAIISQSSLKLSLISITFMLAVYLNAPKVTIEFENLPSFSFDYFSGWLLEIFEGKSSKTYKFLNELPIPELSFETTIGTGMIKLPNGANASGHDSGYIQTYYALGIVLALIFYVTFVSYAFLEILTVIESRNKLVLYGLLFLTLIVEFKEPFIFKYALPFFLISSIKLTKINQ